MKMIKTTMTTIKPQAILTMYKWMTANADSEYGNMALIVIIPIQCCSRSSGASFCWSCVCCKGDSLHWLSRSVLRAMPWLSCNHKTMSLRKRSADFNDQISKMLILINQISKVLSAAEAQAKQAEQQAALMQVLTFFWWKWCWFEVDEKTRKNKLNWFSL